MQLGFYNLDNRFEQVSKHGNSLERLNKVIAFELFRQIWNRVTLMECKALCPFPCKFRNLSGIC